MNTFSGSFLNNCVLYSENEPNQRRTHWTENTLLFSRESKNRYNSVNVIFNLIFLYSNNQILMTLSKIVKHLPNEAG